MANAQVRVTMVDTVRGGQHLFYEGFKFRCKKTVREKKYWNCVVAACRASVITENGILQAALQVNHTHQPIQYEMEVESFKSKLMHRAKTETTPIPTIYGDEISRLRRHHDVVPDDLLKEIPSFASLKTILYRQRHKTLPKLPKQRRTRHSTNWIPLVSTTQKEKIPAD
ncbi:uncharacterized protein LOC125373037 [Haliotis rufescens]|uniref:uncharacterized protein LOC125373037 n=1 Tax=Haliotis rufescens TaxID=6454 RepID=UPI00201F109A|nr:uncharacterized protein LOC125373037 [Haliotis rufescens]